MKEFAYRGIKEDGEVETGTLAATDTAAASSELFARGITAVEISEGGPTLMMRLNEPFTLFDRPSQRDVQMFLRDLARLHSAGLSVDGVLRLLHEMQEKESFAEIIGHMREFVRQGEALSFALSQYPKCFPVQITASVQAGENSGTISETLASIANSMDQALTFKERARAALIYPSILMMMVVATFVLVIGFVLPQFKPLFDGNEDKLPMITRGVMMLGDLLAEYGTFIGLFIVAAVFLGVWSYRDPFRKGQFYQLLCRGRWLKKWLLTPDIIRFVRTLGVCTKSGLPLDRSLAMAVETVRMPHIVDDLLLLRAEVRRGGLLSQSIETRSWFPALVLQFSKVGEQSGELGAMLDEAADIMSHEYEARLEKLLEVLSPLLTLLMGGIVALLVGSVLLGIMSVNNVAF